MEVIDATSTQEDLRPNIVEELNDNVKTVTISSPDGYDPITMIDIPVSTSIPEIFKVGEENRIKIKMANNDDKAMQFVAHDDDGNGLIDHVSWIVPHLSTQVFEVVLISNAVRLDADKNIVEDILI